MDGARSLPGFLAGIVLFDIIINLPGFSPASPFASLLSPSLDLLVVLAVFLTAARGGSGVRTGFAVGVAVLVGLTVGLRGYLRWGAPEAGRFLAAGAVLPLIGLGGAGLGAAGLSGLASFFLSRPVYRGLADVILRSLFILAVACCTVVQALLGARIFAPSGVPGMLRVIGERLW
jgi:hypothetical protein